MNRRFRFVILLLIITCGLGCVYFNTFYYARKHFNEAESKRKNLARGSSTRSLSGFYSKAADKAEKVLEKWPDSKWADDALYVCGVSYFYMEKFDQSEKRFRELIANYPESEYIRESRVYLAQTKLKLKDIDEAMALFEELYYGDEKKDVKMRAAMALGDYYFQEKDYKNAEVYFQTLVDSLGDDETKQSAQMSIADGQFSQFNYIRALEAYRAVLDMDPEKDIKYMAVFHIGECRYFLGDIEGGLEDFQRLADDEIFYDSLAAVKLMIALGHEMDGDLELAEEVYEKIIEESASRGYHATMANFNLGLIYQYDYEDFKKAKEYYDKAKSGGARSDVYQDALQRSSDIGKLELYYQKQVFDSTATREDFENAALTQYLLAELYLIQLAKPDSAMQELDYIMESFPETDIAPKSLISMAIIQRDYYDDTLAFDTALRAVLRKYPRSDYIPDAIDLLGLAGTAADTGYAEKYYEQAERFFLDTVILDSARHYLREIIDSFPRSSLNMQARYTNLWLTEMYDNPGDSSVYYAYVDFLDSFPTGFYVDLVEQKLRAKTPKRPVYADVEEDTPADDIAADSTEADTSTTPGRALTPEERYYIGPEGARIPKVKEDPMKVDKEFRYPTAAYYLNFAGHFYFQVKIDAFGDVTETKLMNPSPSEELNQEAYETVTVSHFNTAWIPPELFDTWFVYKFYVKPPDVLK